MKSLRYFLLIAISFALSCHPTKKMSEQTKLPTDDHLITFSFLQMNDVYEITPLEGGKVGGMARVATLRKQILKKNNNLLTVHAGDFLNPSLIGTIKQNGKRISGRQMIDVMNATGVDLATYGNHEFDLKEADFQERLNESTFTWTSCNTFQRCGDRTYPFYKEINGRKQFVEDRYIWNISDADGTAISVGIFGVTLPVNQVDYVHYDDFFAAAKTTVAELKQQSDVVIGLTHLELQQDKALAEQIEGVPLFMGGHDHDNMKHTVNNIVITKADANVKTVYLHTLTHNKLTKETKLTSELIKIDESISFDPDVQAVVEKWRGILMENIKDVVPDAERVIYFANEPLDGRESTNRLKQTNLGNIMTKSYFLAAKNPVDGALMNSGSIRIDDQMVGAITTLDIFRALPFGGGVIEVDMTGTLLKQLLDAGEQKIGNGAYLQLYKINGDSKSGWIINGTTLDTNRNYRIAMNDFMLSGYDHPFFTKDNPGILKITAADPADPDDLRRDVRVAIADYLSKLK